MSSSSGSSRATQEDLAGRPFVGPAGRVLDEGLAAAGIDRSQVYVTNAVKHFKWEPRGKRRIHQKPNWAEMIACRPWLEAELAVVKPDVLVCLGATAAQSLLGAPVPRHQDARRARGVGARPVRPGDRASVVDPPSAGRRRAAGGDAGLHP